MKVFFQMKLKKWGVGFMAMTKEQQRDLLILEMERCIELLKSSNLSKTIPCKNYGTGGFWNVVNRDTSELSMKLREVRRDSIRLMKTIYSEKEI